MKQNSHVLELKTSSVTVLGNTSSYKTFLNEPSDSLEDKVSDGSLHLQLNKICCHKSFVNMKPVSLSAHLFDVMVLHNFQCFGPYYYKNNARILNIYFKQF